MKLRLHYKNGFTLIELLVVISIIGLLSSIVLASLSTAKMKARDARRIADIRTVKILLEQYITEYGVLPTSSSYGEATRAGGYWDYYWDLSTEDTDGDGRLFLDFLLEGSNPIAKQVPIDPLNSPLTSRDDSQSHYPQASGYRYFYFVTPPNSGSCMRDSGSVYMIGITRFESLPNGSYNSSCSCLWDGINPPQPDYFKSAFGYITCGTF